MTRKRAGASGRHGAQPRRCHAGASDGNRALDAMNARALRCAQLTEGVGGALSCTRPLCMSGAKCQDGDPLSVRYDELPLLTPTAR
jgi:hypothetical protein